MDEAQKLILRHGLGRRNTRTSSEWSAQRVAFWIPRQNGKGDIFIALELAWLFLDGFSVPLAIHSAHEYPTSAAAFEKMKDIIEGSSDLMGLLKGRPRQTNGEQGFTTKAGAVLRFRTRTRTGARGLSAPRLVLDEAQEVREDHMAAIAPTLSAMPDPQLWFAGTPPSVGDEWCYNLRDAGEAGDGDLMWADWGRDIDLDNPEDAKRVHDMEEARLSNPALGTRILARTVRNEMKPSGLGARYAHERLGVWPPRVAKAGNTITAEQWRAQTLETAARPVDLAMAVMVSHTRRHTAIVAVGPLETGELVATVVDYRPGTAWVAARVAQLKERWKPIAIAVEDRGPTASLLPELATLEVVPSEDPDQPMRGDLIIPHAGDVGVAFGQFVDAVEQGRLFHFDELSLTSGLLGAGTRPLPAGGTTWDYRGKIDTSCVRAATNALWAYLARVGVVDDDGDYDVADSVL